MGDVARGRLRRDLGNWRLWLVRIITNALAVIVTVLVLPGLRFERYYLGFFVLTGLLFGLMNAFIKPLIQFFALRYLVASYGFVVIAINAFLLYLLSLILNETISARGLVSLLVGGLVVGTLGLVFDTLAGATPPILDRQPEREESP
jgi:putative membrane protein